MPMSILMSKNLFLLNLSKFGTFDVLNILILILISRITFMKYFPIAQIKNARNLLKFGTSDLSKIPISILMSKTIFMKCLPPVRPKLVPKLKVHRIY